MIEYEVTAACESNSTGTRITCYFPDDPATIHTSCVVVIHTRISKLTSNGLMELSSYLLTRSDGSSTSVFIPGVNLEEYQFGAIGGELREDDVDQLTKEHGRLIIQ